MILIPYLSTKVRILTPDEYEKMCAAIEDEGQRIRFKTAVFTGMRYTEFYMLHGHPEWYDVCTYNIQLPVLFSPGGARATPGRLITPISREYPEIIKNFLSDEITPPTRNTWNEQLKRWAKLAGIGDEGVSNKMTRFTLEAWMVASDISLSYSRTNICSRQGYDMFSKLERYENLAFTEDDKAKIRELLSLEAE